jgi:hypothetical protein
VAFRARTTIEGEINARRAEAGDAAAVTGMRNELVDRKELAALVRNTQRAKAVREGGQVVAEVAYY